MQKMRQNRIVDPKSGPGMMVLEVGSRFQLDNKNMS